MPLSSNYRTRLEHDRPTPEGVDDGGDGESDHALLRPHPPQLILVRQSVDPRAHVLCGIMYVSLLIPRFIMDMDRGINVVMVGLGSFVQGR